MEKKKDFIEVIMQAFYGNRTGTELREEDIDGRLQGWMSKECMLLDYEVDRSMVKIPNSNCVIVYNKFQEEGTREENKKILEEEGYRAKPLAFIPEENIEIYSRCFVCRLGLNGELESLREEDYSVIFNYLAA